MIRLLPQQIPAYWELIKFVVIKLGEITEPEVPIYLNKVLYLLLNDKAQCWVNVGDDKQINNIHLTKIVYSPFTDEKNLEWCGTYAFKFTENSAWQEMESIIEQYAKQSGCSSIYGETKNKRILDIAYNCGFKEKSVNFFKPIGV